MRRHVLLSFTACIAAAALAGRAPRGVAAAQTASTGTIEGHVRMSGPSPANPIIRMGADPKCGKINAGKRLTQEFVIRSADGGLSNAFVSLQGTFAQVPVPSEPVTIDQQGCIYAPRVVGARVGQTLQIRNSDPTFHNVHSSSTKGNEFNVGEPVMGMVYKYQLKNADLMLRLKCDVHSWMIGYIGVVAHPYFGVSREGGAFTIARVPAGKHTIQVWHERYGPLTKTVDIKAGSTTIVDFTYTGTEKPGSSAEARDLVLPAGVLTAQLLAPPR